MRIGQSFTLKSSAIKWASKTLSELQEGTFKNRDKLFKMKLRELLTLYADKYRNKYRSKSFEFAIRVINRSNIDFLKYSIK